MGCSDVDYRSFTFSLLWGQIYANTLPPICPPQTATTTPGPLPKSARSNALATTAGARKVRQRLSSSSYLCLIGDRSQMWAVICRIRQMVLIRLGIAGDGPQRADNRCSKCISRRTDCTYVEPLYVRFPACDSTTSAHFPIEKLLSSEVSEFEVFVWPRRQLRCGAAISMR